MHRVLAAAASLAVAAASPRVEKSTPTPCKPRGEYTEEQVDAWINEHLAGARALKAKRSREVPIALITLGGSGAGKSRALSFVAEETAGFVHQGLDEYIEYIPEYRETLARKHEVVYEDAADACYDIAIRVAKKAQGLIVDEKLDVIFEETGKDPKRLKERVLPLFEEFEMIVVAVDNDADTAIARAHDRFLATGRYASADYIRGTFVNLETSYRIARAHADESLMCDNHGAETMCVRDKKHGDGWWPADSIALDIDKLHDDDEHHHDADEHHDDDEHHDEDEHDEDEHDDEEDDEEHDDEDEDDEHESERGEL